MEKEQHTLLLLLKKSIIWFGVNDKHIFYKGVNNDRIRDEADFLGLNTFCPTSFYFSINNFS